MRPLVAIGAIAFSGLTLASAPASTVRMEPQLRTPQIREFHLRPAGPPECLALGPDGNIYVPDATGQGTSQSLVVRVDTQGRETGRFAYGSNSDLAFPGDITAGPDGAMWIAAGSPDLVRMTLKGQFDYFSQVYIPVAVAPGPDKSIWFSIGNDTSGFPVGYFTQENGFKIFGGLSSAPGDITEGPDGAMWFTEQKGTIGRITMSGTLNEYSTGNPTVSPISITTGPDANLWFTEPQSKSIARMTTSGKVKVFNQGISGDPRDIVTGPDGALWFTEMYANLIGRITTDGKVTEFSKEISPSAMPDCIIRGPDGHLWFSELNNRAIARVTL